MTMIVTTYRHAPELTTPREVTRVVCNDDLEALDARASHTSALLRRGYAMCGIVNLGERLVFTKVAQNAPTRVYSIVITPSEAQDTK